MGKDNSIYVELLLIGVSHSTAKNISEGRKLSRRGRKPTEAQQKKICAIAGVSSYEELLEGEKSEVRFSGSNTISRKLSIRVDSPYVKFKELFGNSTDEVYEMIIEVVLSEMKRGEKGSTVEIFRSYLNRIEEDQLVSSLSTLLEDD